MNELIKLNQVQTMSSREIAGLTEKNHQHVLRDCDVLNESYEKLSLSKIGQSNYVAENGQTYREYLLTKIQCFDLMTGYNVELRIKVNRRWEELETKDQSKLLSPAELILQQAQMLVEQEKRIIGIEDKLNNLEAKTATLPDYFTIAGYATLHNLNINIKQASRLGKMASIACKVKRLPVDSIPDPRFGKVGAYPEDVLREIFNYPINLKK